MSAAEPDRMREESEIFETKADRFSFFFSFPSSSSSFLLLLLDFSSINFRQTSTSTSSYLSHSISLQTFNFYFKRPHPTSPFFIQIMSGIYIVLSSEVWIDDALQLDIKAPKVNGIYSSSNKANKIAKAVTKTLWVKMESSLGDSSDCEYWNQESSSEGYFIGNWKTKKAFRRYRPHEPFSFSVEVVRRKVDDSENEEILEGAELDSASESDQDDEEDDEEEDAEEEDSSSEVESEGTKKEDSSGSEEDEDQGDQDRTNGNDSGYISNKRHRKD